MRRQIVSHSVIKLVQVLANKGHQPDQLSVMLGRFMAAPVVESCVNHVIRLNRSVDVGKFAVTTKCPLLTHFVTKEKRYLARPALKTATTLVTPIL